MEIRKANIEDLDKIMTIYEIGRQTMRKNGNDKQWINGFPKVELIKEDIKTGISYVIVEKEIVHAVFALIFGKDHTYTTIYNGSWPDEKPYATIHRIASDSILHGVVQFATDFAFTKIDHIRIDTHELNSIMQKTLKGCGYNRCGIIYIDDGSPRIAFEIHK